MCALIYAIIYPGMELILSLLQTPPELLELTEDHGGNTVIRAHPERFLPVEVAQEELTDVDTPQALRELEEEQHN